MRILVALVVLLSATKAIAYNAGLEAGSKIAVTRASATDSSIYRVWAVDNGNVVSRYDTPLSSGGSQWTNHGNGGQAASLHGVATTWYISSGSIYEHVFYMSDTGLTLYMGTSINRGPVSWAAWATPTAPTTVFLSHLAASTIVAGGVRILLVAGVDQGTLWRWGRAAIGGSATWTSVGGFYWTAQSGLVSTTDPSETYTEFFVNHTPATGSVGVMRWNPSTGWTVQDIGHPVGESCAPAAAIQGSFAVPASGYRLTLACGNSNGTFHLASAPSETSTSFAWASYSLPTPGLYPFVGGAVRPGTGSQLVHEFFYTTAANSLMKIDLAPATETITDIGVTRDIDVFSGGIAVAPRALASRVFYLGSLTNASRLFERLGQLANAPADYRWLGSPSTLPYWATPTKAAEGKIAGWKGTEAMSMINRPGSGPTDWPSVYLMFTNTQNETTDFSTAKSVTKSILLPGGFSPTLHNYISDPTVVVSDTKRAYSVQIGVVMSSCASGSVITRTTIYMVSTADGITHTAPQVIATSALSGVDPAFDHPWADIEHVTGGNDIIHIVWWDLAAGRVKYTRYTVNVGLGPIFSLAAGAGAPPKITVSDAGRAIVYLGDTLGNVRICEINSAHTDCTTPGWQTVTNYFSHNIQVIPAVSAIEAVSPISMVASETDTNLLYYCLDVKETNLTNSDVRCGRMIRDVNGLWSVQASSIVNTVANDAKDQFLPEVVITSEDDSYSAGQDTVMATWFDRSNSPTNYAYQIMKAVSLDGASTFAPPLVGIAAFSDPEYLPRHCRKPSVRFAGDYNAAEGDLLHKNVPAVIVPPGMTIGTQVLSFPMGLGSWSN